MKWLRCQYTIGPREFNFEKTKPDILEYFCPYKIQKKGSNRPFLRNFEGFSIIKATGYAHQRVAKSIKEVIFLEFWKIIPEINNFEAKRVKPAIFDRLWRKKGQYQRKNWNKNYPAFVKIFLMESDTRDQNKTTQPFIIQLGYTVVRFGARSGK